MTFKKDSKDQPLTSSRQAPLKQRPDIFKKDSKDSPFSKPLLEELVPGYVLMQGDLLAEGGNKYGYRNWRNAKPEDMHHYWGALFRHSFQAYNSEKMDRLRHLAAVGVNANFLWYYEDNKI